MPELFCGLLGFLAVMALITVVGHGIWLVIAAIVRAASDSNSAQESANRIAEEQRLRDSITVLEELFEQKEISRDACIAALEGISKSYDRKRLTQPVWLSSRITSLKVASVSAPAPKPSSPSPEPLSTSEPEIIYAEATVAPPAPASQRPIEIIDAELIPTPKSLAPPKAQAPWDVPDAPRTAPVVLAPQKSLADILQSFMEESNIRWGEIIAGLCIVISAIGLVVSLRNALKSVPYFPAILFLAFTLAFHGAALYTLRRWKLQVVSRVALLIAMLLVPLNFAAGVMLGGEQEHMRPLSDPLVLIASAIGAVACGWIAISSGIAVLSRRGWIAGLAIVVCSLSEVVLRRMAGVHIGLLPTMLLGAVPLAAFVAGIAAIVLPMRERNRFGPAHASAIFSALGTTLFAMLTPLAILLVDSLERRDRLAELSPILTIAGAIALGVALMVERRVRRPELASLRVVATSVAVICIALLLGLFVAAWPRPVILAVVCGVLAVSFGLLTWATRLAPLALASVLSATFCWTMLVHLFTGSVKAEADNGLSLVTSLASGRTAWILLPAAIASIGLTFSKRFLSPDSRQFVQYGGASVIGLSAFIALMSGFLPLTAWEADRSLASPLLLVYGSALIFAAPKVGARFLAPFGCGLFWSGLVHLLWQNQVVIDRLKALNISLHHPVHLSTLICAVLFAIGGGVTALICLGLTPIQLGGKQRRNLRDTLVEPLAWCGFALALAAAPNSLWPDLGDLTWNFKAATALTIAMVGVFVSLRKPWLVSCVQGCLALALAYGGAWRRVLTPDIASNWIAPDHLLVQLVIVAIGVLIWSSARKAIAKSFLFREFASSPYSQVDRVLHVVAAALCVLLVAVRLIDGIAHELASGELKPDAAWIPTLELCSPFYASIWITCGVIAGFVAYFEKPQWSRLAIVAILAYLSIPIGAIAFDLPGDSLPTGQVATASALRWLSAALGIVLTAVILGSPLWARGAPRWLVPQECTPRGLELSPLWIAGIPVIFLTALSVVLEVSGVATGGPIAGTFFAKLGPVINHGVPLFTVSAIYLVYSLAKRQPALAAGASLVFQFGINLAFLLYAKDNLDRGTVLGIDWLVWNALAAGGFGLLWTLLFQRTGSDTLWGRRLHLAQVTIAARLGAGISVVLAGWITVTFPPAPHTLQTGGHWLTYLAVAIGIAPLMWRLLSIRAARWGRLSLWAIALLAPLVSFSLGAAKLNDTWLPHRSLEVGFSLCMIAAAVIASFRPAQEEFARSDRNWIGYGSLLIATWLLALAIGAKLEGDPVFGWQEGCCSVAALGCIICGLVLAWELHALASVIAASLAAMLTLFDLPRGIFLTRIDAIELAYIPLRGISAALFVSLIWQARAIWEVRDAAFTGRQPLFRWVHHVTALIALPLLLLVSLAIFALGLNTRFPPLLLQQTLFHFAGLVIPTGFFFAALWDKNARYALASLFTLGLCVILPIVSLMPLREIDKVQSLALAVAIYIAICGQLFAFGANLAAWGKKSGIPDVVEGLNRLQFWLPGTLLILTTFACTSALLTVLNSNLLELRTAIALTPLAAVWGVANLASTDRRAYARVAAILLAVGGAVLLSWAQLPPVHYDTATLERAFRVLVVLCAATLVLGLILPRWIIRGGTWFPTFRFSAMVTGIAAFAALALTLALEVNGYLTNKPSPSDLHVIVVAVALVGLIAGLLSLALSKTIGSADWSEDHRMGFVYAAQATGGLLFGHLYFCRNEWFDPHVIPYWPYFVMGIAFASAGAGEIFQRSKIRVLSKPFQRSGLFLPLLPMLGMWLHAGSADRPLVLLVGAILYLFTSISSKSSSTTWFSIGASIVAGNAALWTFYSDRGLEFLEHPQMWLIPPAVCVLIAAQIQRERLEANLLAAIRYAAMIVIYVSSTSEIFINNMGKEFWPPLILLGLSVFGAMLGIAFRVRAFLFLGFAFTLVSLTAMVWYASTALFVHVWPWWAFGIGVGIAILVLFGYFEKNKAEVRALIERLRRWEA